MICVCYLNLLHVPKSEHGWKHLQPMHALELKLANVLNACGGQIADACARQGAVCVCVCVCQKGVEIEQSLKIHIKEYPVCLMNQY